MITMTSGTEAEVKGKSNVFQVRAVCLIMQIWNFVVLRCNCLKVIQPFLSMCVCVCVCVCTCAHACTHTHVHVYVTSNWVQRQFQRRGCRDFFSKAELLNKFLKLTRWLLWARPLPECRRISVRVQSFGIREPTSVANYVALGKILFWVLICKMKKSWGDIV